MKMAGCQKSNVLSELATYCILNIVLIALNAIKEYINRIGKTIRFNLVRWKQECNKAQSEKARGR